MKIRNSIAKLLFTLANYLNPNKKPAAKSATLSITRMNGAMIGMGQWVVQALITKKTPHPGNHDSVTVFFPQLDLKMVTDGEIKTFTLSALVTTMRYSSFGQFTGTISIRPHRQNDSRISEWHVIDAQYELTGWGEEKRRFKFNESMVGVGQPKNHLLSHFIYYFDRFLEDNRKKV